MRCRAFALVVSAGFLGSLALAQEPTKGSAEPVFQSHGITVKVTQASASKDGNELNIVAVIENRNNYDLLAVLL
jgi:hypothetical protein